MKKLGVFAASLAMTGALALTEAVNEAIAKLTDDGTVDELMTKYNIK